MSLLPTIKSPEDLKRLRRDQLPQLAQEIRDRLNSFFSPVQRGGNGRREGFQRGGARPGGRGGAAPQGTGGGSRGVGVSDRLARSGLVRGHRDLPALRESVLALTIVNHPQLLLEEYDEIAAIDFENRDLQRFWSAMLPAAATAGANLSREYLTQRLSAEGFDAILKLLDQQIRNARLWTATQPWPWGPTKILRFVDVQGNALVFTKARR